MEEVMENEDARGAVSQMGSSLARSPREPRDFRIAGLSIIAHRGKGRGDSRLLIGPGIVHASLAHRGCPL